MKRTSLIYISLLTLLAGIAGITLWRINMSPGDAFAFCIISLLFVWPLCCIVSGMLWSLSGAKRSSYFAFMIIAAVAEPVLAYLDMFDLAAFCLGAFATVIPALAGLAIGQSLKNRREQQ